MSTRNEIIFERKMNGETLASLASEYNVSRSRIEQIVKQEAAKREYNSNPLYQVIYKTVEELGYSTSTMPQRVFNTFRRKKVNTIEDLKGLDLNEYKCIKAVGPCLIEVIEKIMQDSSNTM